MRVGDKLIDEFVLLFIDILGNKDEDKGDKGDINSYIGIPNIIYPLLSNPSVILIFILYLLYAFILLSFTNTL